MTSRGLAFAVAAAALAVSGAAAAAVPPQLPLLAEISPGRGLSIGGGVALGGARPARPAQFVAWYQTVRLEEADAKARRDGVCRFEVTFTLANPTNVPVTTPFEVGFQVAAPPGAPTAQGFGGYTLATRQTRTDTRTLDLKPGKHVQLTYWVDINDKVPEVNNTLANNRVWIFYDLPGRCGAAPVPPAR